MPKHHLDALSHALTQKGWKIVSTRTLDDSPYDFHAWTVERGTVSLEIQFARFGGIGEDLPLDKSYACSVSGHDDISLYFSKPSGKWNADVASFVSALDDTNN
ncbi:MAG: hypothetical protein IH991_07815 [Planctomycetes bacterium]|nr:hypothetical protein [Planctomycetota bacterium]